MGVLNMHSFHSGLSRKEISPLYSPRNPMTLFAQETINQALLPEQDDVLNRLYTNIFICYSAQFYIINSRPILAILNFEYFISNKRTVVVLIDVLSMIFFCKARSNNFLDFFFIKLYGLLIIYLVLLKLVIVFTYYYRRSEINLFVKYVIRFI